MSDTLPDFDGVARAYRWLEYASLGPLLERARDCHLARLSQCRHALVLGDGDGRFTARMLANMPKITIEAVDLSGVMLELLRQRCAAFQNRVQTFQRDARTFRPLHQPDLVVTHFFLDCLTQQEVDALVARLTPNLARNALWLVSDFRIPAGALRWPAWIYIRALYFVFRILTGLRTTRLPNHPAVLERHGFTLVARQRRMFGILTSEVWQRT
jgi:SAM-dependent methyltransferase